MFVFIFSKHRCIAPFCFFVLYMLMCVRIHFKFKTKSTKQFKSRMEGQGKGIFTNIQIYEIIAFGGQHMIHT